MTLAEKKKRIATAVDQINASVKNAVAFIPVKE